MVLLEGLDEGGHGRAADAGGEPHVDVLDLAAGLDLPRVGDVADPDGETPVVLAVEGLLAVAAAELAVALPALRPLENLLALGDQLLAERRPVGRQGDHLAGSDRIQFRVLELEGEGLDVGDDRPALLLAQPVLDQIAVEGLHAGPRQPPADGAEEVLVGWQLAALGRAELEGAEGEVPRPGIEVLCRGSLAVAQKAVAEAAAPEIDPLALVHEFRRRLGHGFVRAGGGGGYAGVRDGQKHDCSSEGQDPRTEDPTFR
jgi:hypothetical protein